MRRSVRSTFPSLFLLGALGLAACGDDATDPPDDLLAGLDEAAIHAVVHDRLGIFGPSVEASAVLRYALGSPLRALDGFPASWVGETVVYDENSDAFVVDDTRPAVPANVARITWVGMAGDFVAVPVDERGYVDVLPGTHPTLTTLGLTAALAGDAVRADYQLTFGETESGSTRTDVFEAVGFVSDGSRQLEFHLVDERAEALATGDETAVYSLSLAGQGFTYAGAVEEIFTDASDQETVELVVSTTVDGVTTRLDLQLQGSSTAALQGTGGLRHAGQRIADIEMAGTQMSFRTVDGRAFSGAQQQRLGSLVVILLNPMTAVEPYFW